MGLKKSSCVWQMISPDTSPEICIWPLSRSNISLTYASQNFRLSAGETAPNWTRNQLLLKCFTTIDNMLNQVNMPASKVDRPLSTDIYHLSETGCSGATSVQRICKGAISRNTLCSLTWMQTNSALKNTARNKGFLMPQNLLLNVLLFHYQTCEEGLKESRILFNFH